MSPVRAYIVCPGVGHINRGFETFTRECFNALKSSPELDLQLFKGAGEAAPGERAIVTFRRTSPAAAILGALLLRNRRNAPGAGEALSFGTSLLPHLLKDRPNVVLFSDRAVGRVLRIWRSSFHLSFKLLFSNGGPCPPERFRWDHIQQVSPQYFEQALAAGVPSSCQTLLPYGHDITQTIKPLSPDVIAPLRRSLGLPSSNKIVLSVGAIERGGHKRSEYLIEEIARIPEPRPFLVILGEKQQGADEIERRAVHCLGAEGFTIRTVPRRAVDDFYKSADLFVLASLREGFGRVFVEAMAQGLRSVTHDHLTARYVLGPHGTFGNLERTGALSSLIQAEVRRPDSHRERVERHRAAYERFSWHMLAPPYVDMLLRVSRLQTSSGARPAAAKTGVDADRKPTSA